MKLAIGDNIKEKRVITGEDVMRFAEFSLDYNPIHFEAESAKEQGFKDRIVPGMLIGSLFSKIIGTELPGDGTIYVSQDLRFLKPVYLNEEITLQVTVDSYLGHKHFLLVTDCFDSSMDIVVKGKAEVLVREYEE